MVALIVGARLGCSMWKTGFACCDEGAKSVTFFVLYALLVDLPLDFIKDEGNKVSRVLESDREIPSVSCVGQKGDIGHGIVDGKIETVLVVVCIGIVRIHAIARHASCEVEPLQHDISDI